MFKLKKKRNIVPFSLDFSIITLYKHRFFHLLITPDNSNLFQFPLKGSTVTEATNVSRERGTLFCLAPEINFEIFQRGT